MIFCENDSIKHLSVHNVGRKESFDNSKYSISSIELDDNVSSILVHYFVTAFKSSEYYNLFHDADIRLNEVFAYVSKIFDDPDCLHEQSINLAKHLSEQSNHPKIKSGEFYVVYFTDCIIDGDMVDAVGLFKSENKDTFLNVISSGDNFEIESQEGVNINKLDKGCLIFNKDKESGYVVAIVDNTNKSAEAHYWVDDFLHVRQRQDKYHNTQNLMTLAKDFVNDLPKEFEGITKADQADLINKTVKFFKEKDSFDMDEFANEVIERPDVISSFNEYKDSYAKDRDIEIVDSFDISDTAVKKQARSLKSVIKLDKNFHIYIHGDRNMIENGEDNKGKFYKVYYNEEQ